MSGVDGNRVKATIDGTEYVHLFPTSWYAEEQALLSTVKVYMQSGGTAGPGIFTSVTASSLTGSADPFPIVGVAGTTGGAVSLAGGVSSATNGTGGAASIAGGAGKGTSAGGAANFQGGAGAASGTGNGGDALFSGGSSGSGATGNAGATNVGGGNALSTNGNGSAVAVVGGNGAGTGAGGNILILGGSAGATGTPGTIALTAGTATAAAGASVTITAGAAAGGNRAGGVVNLVPGAASGSGLGGEVQVNSDSNLIPATYFFTGTPAATTQAFFTATRACRVKTMCEIHSTAAGGTSTMDITKDTSTNAPGAGTSLFQSGSFNLNGTANTVQNASVTTTVATATLAAGDRLSVKFANAIQASAGIVVTVMLAPI